MWIMFCVPEWMDILTPEITNEKGGRFIMRNIKKLALLLLTAGVLCGSFSGRVNAETKQFTLPAGAIAGGEVDKEYGHFTWVIDGNGKLTVNGTGNVRDVERDGSSPWNAVTSFIKSAEISVTGMTDAAYLFHDCYNMESVELTNMDTESITNMTAMFGKCKKLTSVDVSHFETENVRSMNSMFYDCKKLTSVDVSGFNTQNVRDMNRMFSNCESLTGLDVSGFETEAAQNMEGMFYNCKNLTSLDVSGFETKNVTNMYEMFAHCKDLTSLDVSGFNTELVTDMGSMFNYCENLTSLDVSNFKTNNVTDMSYMFAYCKKVGELDVSVFNTANVTNMDYMFHSCQKITSLDLSSFEMQNAKKAWMLDMLDSLVELHTPCNVVCDVYLPGSGNGVVWSNEVLGDVTMLPKGAAQSFLLQRKAPGTDGPATDDTLVSNVFTDVYDEWYNGYVQYVYDNGLMTGIKETTEFRPNANITKAQVAQVLYNMEKNPTVENLTVFDDLSDVYEGEWYAKAVAWAYNTGIVTGDLNTKKFNPNADVTREQLALMMFRYAKFKSYNVETTSDFAGLENADKVSDWSMDGVKWAVGSGLISGIEKDGAKDLAPQGNATRAQMAAILQRFCEKY